jgi:DNA repair exonuclease SbcCD ATPase subunit
MTTVHKSIAAAASLLLALAAASVAVAQTAPAKPAAKAGATTGGKTLGGSAGGSGKRMTRDELRTCLMRLDELNQGTKVLEGQRPQLDREREELTAAGEALKTERAELDRQLALVREWENKVSAHKDEIAAFNKRNDAAAAAPRNQREQLIQELTLERERLEKARAVLAAEEARLVPAYKAGAAAHNERVKARDARAVDWNSRNAAAVDTSASQQAARALWVDECANRPYLEDDEIAIKAGK